MWKPPPHIHTKDATTASKSSPENNVKAFTPGEEDKITQREGKWLSQN